MIRSSKADQSPGRRDGNAAGRKNAAKVLVIGLDIADGDLIDRWCDEGYLPTLCALREQGVRGRLASTAEFMHVSAWPTIHTGTLPGKHGIYHAYQIRAGEQTIHRASADECAEPPFWKFLDDAGRRCVVLDAFFNHPVQGFRGVQILEYGTWTWFWKPVSTPRKIRKELTRQFGAYPVPEHTKILTVPDPEKFRDVLVSGAAVKAKVARWLMGEKPWELFYVTFAEPHGAGHFLWHLSDRDHPAHAEVVPPGLEDPLRDVYVAVDSAIGELLRGLDDSVNVIVVSGDGIGPNYAGCHLLPGLLSRLGHYHGASVGSSAEEDGGARSKKGALSVLREMIPLEFRQAVSSYLPRSIHYRLSLKWANTGIDWERTRAFVIPNANEGYVRLNLEGREPQGTVDPGGGYGELLVELKEAMEELVNPANGRSAARRVVLTDDLFPGAHRADLPDMIVTWDPEAMILSELSSERTGTVRGVAAYETAPYYTGNHRPNAFVIGRGPGIAAGRVLRDGHIVDLAPTILAMLGVEPPARMDGRAWAEFTGRAPGP
jgi:predicted AlkP superfamily phosphohydrolase/phosphomutase